MSKVRDVRAAAERVREKIEKANSGALGRIGQLERGLGETAASMRQLRDEMLEQHGRLQEEADRRHAEREEAALTREASYREELEDVLDAVQDLAKLCEQAVETVKLYGGDAAPLALPAPAGPAPQPADAQRIAELEARLETLEKREFVAPAPALSGEAAMFPTLSKTSLMIKEQLVQLAAEQASIREYLMGGDDESAADAYNAALEAKAKEIGVEIKDQDDAAS